MTYAQQSWTDNVTPVDAAHMNHIEAGIAAAALAVGLPGAELAYAEFTADVTVTTTSQAGATTIVTAPPVTFDGSTPVMVEFQASRAEIVNTASCSFIFDLWDGSTDLGFIGSIMVAFTSGSGSTGAPFIRARRLTPSAGSHTFSVRAWLGGTATNGIVRASPAGGGGNLPGHIRIIRV